jgi:hypothetical protein
MSNWETLEELLKKPLPSPNIRDPFYHTQQFPKFMKRKTVLDQNYDPKLEHLKKTTKDFVESNFNSYQRKRLKSDAETFSSRLSDYDEAVNNQRVFTSSSPKNDSGNGEFKYSICPRPEIRSVSNSRKKQKEKRENSNKLSKNFIKNDLNLMKGNIKVLIVKNSKKKCQDCGLDKCACQGNNDELISRVFRNLNKGKVLLEQIRLRKKKTLAKVRGGVRKIQFDTGMIRFYFSGESKAEGLPEINSRVERSRRNSN